MLQKEWYAIIAADGFVDIEHTVGDDQELIQSATYPYRYNPSVIERMNKQAYYEQLSECISTNTFPNQVDATIMAKRSEGYKISEIVRELESLGHKRERSTVRFIIRKYESAWGIRTWEPKQLTKNRKKQ